MTLLQAALEYAAMGWSVFPVREGGKLPATEHGHLDATREARVIQHWWQENPLFNIGIATGEVSGITVIDVDGPKGIESSKTIVVPETRVIKTPHGYHLYYQYNPAFHTGAGFLPGLDVRNGTKGASNGGYVVAPPSIVDGHEYTVLRDRDMEALELVPEVFMKEHRNGATPDVQPTWVGTLLRTGSTQGARNNDATRLAGYLHGKGHAEDIIISLMTPFAEKSQPPFSERDLAKVVKSVGRYPADTDSHNEVTSHTDVTGNVTQSLSAKILEWVGETSGWFELRDLDKEMAITADADKHNRTVILARMIKADHIERHPSINGRFRHVESYSEEIDFKSTTRGLVLDLHWPMQIEDYVHLYPGNLAVLAGNSNAGKTAFCLSFIHLNHEGKMPVYYLCSEMEGEELGDRLAEFGIDIEWRFKAKDRKIDFDQAIVPDAINVIDYIDLDTDWFLIKRHLEKIRLKLGRGFALVAMQKKGNLELGYGQDRSLATPKLYLSMSAGKLTIVKGKVPAKRGVSANGLQRTFIIQDGAYFMPAQDDYGWEYPK